MFFAPQEETVSSLGPADGWSARIARWSARAAVVLAVFSGFLFVHSYGVNLYWWDEWDTLPELFQQYAEGTLTPASFWKFHNEHCIPVPKLILFGLGLLSRGNALLNMYVTQVLLAAILAIYYAAFRKQFGRDGMIWLMAPAAFLVFSPRQYENMLWGFQIGFVLALAAAEFSFLCLSRIDCRRHAIPFIGASISGAIAAVSSAQGLLVWPIGLGQLLLVPIGKRPKTLLSMIWAITGIGLWGIFFYNYVKPTYDLPYGFSLEYFVTLAGGSFAWKKPAILLAGGLVLVAVVVAAAFVIVKRQWAQQSFWLATAVFSLGSLALITIGRSAYNLDSALCSRYATLSIPLAISACFILAAQIHDGRNLLAQGLMGALLAAMLLGTVFSFFHGWKIGLANKRFLEYQQFVLCTIEEQSDEQIKVFQPSKADFIRRNAAVLKHLKYNVFSDPALCDRFQKPSPDLPMLTEPTRSGLDNFGAVDDGTMLIHGWAVDWPARDPAGGVAVVIDGVDYPA